MSQGLWNSCEKINNSDRILKGGGSCWGRKWCVGSFPSQRGLIFLFMKNWHFIFHVRMLFCHLIHILLINTCIYKSIFLFWVSSSFSVSNFLAIYRMECWCRCNLYSIMKIFCRLTCKRWEPIHPNLKIRTDDFCCGEISTCCLFSMSWLEGA